MVIQLISIEEAIGVARDPFLEITRKYPQQPSNWNHSRQIFKRESWTELEVATAEVNIEIIYANVVIAWFMTIFWKYFPKLM